MQSCAHFHRLTPPSPANQPHPRPHPLPPLLPITPSADAVAHVKEHPESRSSSLLMALLSGASLFMSLPMCMAATSCRPLQAWRGTPAVWLHVWLLVTDGSVAAHPGDSPPECYDSQLSCHSALCCKWIWRRQFLWCSSQSVCMRLDGCFYCP